jgi:glycine/D-amino acid oxidase-like deaminating enzyme
VGAGVIGASIAFHLARAGAKVVVIEQDQPAGGASGSSFGWINASFYLSPAHFHLRHAAMAAHRRLAQLLPDVGYRWTGTLWFEQQGLPLEQMAKALAACDYPQRIVSRSEVQTLEPKLHDAPDQALLFAQEGAVDAADLTRALLSAAQGLGAAVHLGLGAQSLIQAGGRIVGLATAQGPILADHVIIAAGVGSPALLRDIGLDLPMVPRPGLIVQTAPVPWRLNHILVSPVHEIRQDAMGRLLAPAVSNHQADTAPTVADPQADTQATLENLRRLFAAPRIALDRFAIANRPVPADGLPVIGAAAPGLSLAVMHSGVTLAALVGEGVAAEVLGAPDTPLFAQFRFARFAGQAVGPRG